MDLTNAKIEIRKRWVDLQFWLEETGDLASQKTDAFVDASLKQANEFIDRLDMERVESRKMAQTFFRMLADRLKLEEREEPPSPEEVKEAIDQLKDVGRFSFFVSFSILPGGAALLIALELLARRYGIEWFTFVPSSFRKNLDDLKEEPEPRVEDQPGKDK